MLLRIEAPHYVAGAVWNKRNDGWCCVEAAPIIRWMVGKEASTVGDYLKRKNYHYQWLKERI